MALFSTNFGLLSRVAKEADTRGRLLAPLLQRYFSDPRVNWCTPKISSKSLAGFSVAPRSLADRVHGGIDNIVSLTLLRNLKICFRSNESYENLLGKYSMDCHDVVIDPYPFSLLSIHHTLLMQKKAYGSIKTTTNDFGIACDEIVSYCQ